jgi:hypothetical protein
VLLKKEATPQQKQIKKAFFVFVCSCCGVALEAPLGHTTTTTVVV